MATVKSPERLAATDDLGVLGVGVRAGPWHGRLGVGFS